MRFSFTPCGRYFIWSEREIKSDSCNRKIICGLWWLRASLTDTHTLFGSMCSAKCCFRGQHYCINSLALWSICCVWPTLTHKNTLENIDFMRTFHLSLSFPIYMYVCIIYILVMIVTTFGCAHYDSYDR